MVPTVLALALVVGTCAAFVTDCASNSSETCSGPPTPDQFPQWLEAMQGWAAGVRAQFGINDSLPIFSVPELQWTQVCEMRWCGGWCVVIVPHGGAAVVCG